MLPAAVGHSAPDLSGIVPGAAASATSHFFHHDRGCLFAATFKASIRGMAAIEVRNLCRQYRVYRKREGLLASVRGLFHREYETVLAVQDVSFRIEEGEMVAFLGPNGAGKTTTLKLLSGLVVPSSGTATVLGYVPWLREDPYRRRFSLVTGQKEQLWWDLPAQESFALHREIYRISETDYRRRLDELTEMLEVRRLMARPVRELSLGDYVLSGGEFAALAVIDAAVRLLPGALGDERSHVEESFTANRLDWPHYTRPVEWEGRTVPEVLQGGNHAAIRRWRLQESVVRTWLRRPELLQSGGSGRALSDEERELLNEYLAGREVNGHG